MTSLNTRPARPTCRRRRPGYPRLLAVSLVVVATASCGGGSGNPNHPDDYPPAPGGIGPEFEEPIEPGEPGGEGGGSALRMVPDQEEEHPPPPGGAPGFFR